MLIGPESIESGKFFNYPQDHSLAQLWIVGGSGSTLQTLEAGWEIDGENGGPYLFVATSQNNYANYCQQDPWGQQTSLGTGTCPPWVPNPQASIDWMLPASVSGGAQHELTIIVTQFCTGNTCDWDVVAGVDGRDNATLLGYIPESGYGTGALSNGAVSYFETGGEVDDGSGNFTAVSMGEGAMPGSAASYGKTAYMHDFGYYLNDCFARHPCRNPSHSRNERHRLHDTEPVHVQRDRGGCRPDLLVELVLLRQFVNSGRSVARSCSRACEIPERAPLMPCARQPSWLSWEGTTTHDGGRQGPARQTRRGPSRPASSLAGGSARAGISCRQSWRTPR